MEKQLFIKSCPSCSNKDVFSYILFVISTKGKFHCFNKNVTFCVKILNFYMCFVQNSLIAPKHHKDTCILTKHLYKV